MTKCKFIIYLIFYLLFCLSVSANSQNAVNSDSQKEKWKVKAKKIELNQLLSYWLLNTSHDFKLPKIQKFYHDSTYTFFIRAGSPYKVLNSEVVKINYKQINGDSVLNLFYYNIIPASDRSKINNCGFSLNNPKYNCNYVSDSSIVIYCHYKIMCDLIPVLDKKYSAVYNLKTKTLE